MKETDMSEERRKILDMLAAGRITAEEADKLLAALAEPEGAASGAGPSAGSSIGSRFKYLKILVEPGPESERQDKVNIRVPLKLIRAGLKWAAFIPKEAQSKVSEALKEKGIAMDWTKLRPEDLEDLVSELNDLAVDVEGKEKIRIFCE
jgi:hypothetical protein